MRKVIIVLVVVFISGCKSSEPHCDAYGCEKNSVSNKHQTK